MNYNKKIYKIRVGRQLKVPQNPKKQLTKKEWNKIYEDMEAFSKTGKQDVKLTVFLRRDRDTYFSEN